MIKIVLKDLKLFFTDRRAVLLTFLLPIALISLFAIVYGGLGKKSESRPMPLLVSDEDRSELSKDVIYRLDTMIEFTVIQTTTDSAENMVKKGDYASVFVFHKGFQDSIDNGRTMPLELKYDEARGPEIGLLQASLYSKLMNLIGSKFIKKKILSTVEKKYPDLDPKVRNDINKQISENFATDAGDTADTGNKSTKKEEKQSFIKTTPLVAKQENSPGLVQAVAGTAIMMLLFSVAGMGASLLDEKQEGTLKKLLYSPIRPHEILFGKMVSANVMSVLQLTIMFAFSWFAFGLDVFSNLPGLILMILATAFACSGFGIFLASFAKSRQQVSGLSTLIVLVMSAIGGSMIPIFFMPVWMQKISVLSVNYWGIQGFFDIFWRSLSFTDPAFLTRVLVLFGIGIFLNILALMLFRKNILKLS